MVGNVAVYLLSGLVAQGVIAAWYEAVIYEEEGYKAIPIKEAKETMHASLVYVKGMYQRNAAKEFFKRVQIGKI